MLVHALVPAVRTGPEPAVLAHLDGLDEVLADLVRGGLGVAMLAQDNAAELLLVPVGHVVPFPPLLFLLLLLLPGVGVQVALLPLALHGQVVAELAFLALLARALLVELAQHGLGVHTEGDFLYLDGLEEGGGFSLGGFRGGFLFLAGGLFGFFAFLLGGFGGGGLGLDLGNLFFGLAAFFVLHAKRLVFGDFGGRGFGFGGIVFFGRHVWDWLAEFG